MPDMPTAMSVVTVKGEDNILIVKNWCRQQILQDEGDMPEWVKEVLFKIYGDMKVTK